MIEPEIVTKQGYVCKIITSVGKKIIYVAQNLLGCTAVFLI
jgi:hypothetical protein